MGCIFRVFSSAYALLFSMFALLTFNSKDREVQNVLEKHHGACLFYGVINGVGKADEELRIRHNL